MSQLNYHHLYYFYVIAKEGELESLVAELALNRLDTILSDGPLPLGANVKAHLLAKAA